MRWIVLALALLFSTVASAQCSGVTANGNVCGNLSGSPNVPSFYPLPVITSAQLDAICSTNNDSLIRLTGTWQCVFYRTQQTGNLSYYVNGNSGSTATCGAAGVSTCAVGDDTKDCTSPSNACLTLQRAFSLIIAKIDFAYTYAGTIYLAHNTGTTNYNLTCANGGWVGTAVVNVVGDSNAGAGATVITDPVSGWGLQAKDGCILSLSYLDYADPNNNAAGHILIGNTGGFGHIDGDHIILGATVGTKLQVGVLGSWAATGPITSSGNAAIESAATDGGVVDWGIQTVTESGTPNYTTANAYMVNGGTIKATNTTYSGAATGLKCQITGPMNVGGYDPNTVFPGNANCVQTELIGAVGIQNGASFDYGTAGHPLLSGGGAGTKDSWDTAGVSCTVNTPAHLTVVKGIVTLCN